VPVDLKAAVAAEASELIEKVLKLKYVQPPPKKPRFNYVIDVSHVEALIDEDAPMQRLSVKSTDQMSPAGVRSALGPSRWSLEDSREGDVLGYYKMPLDKVIARGDEDDPATGFARSIKCFLDGISIISLAVACGPECGDCMDARLVKEWWR
jgi:hypothetical protein